MIAKAGFAIDGKLRGCDVARIKVGDIVVGGLIRNRAIIVQQKTGRPVQFELLDPAMRLRLTGALGWLRPDGIVPASRANQAAARERMSRSKGSCLFSRRSRASSSRSATANPHPFSSRRPS